MINRFPLVVWTPFWAPILVMATVFALVACSRSGPSGGNPAVPAAGPAAPPTSGAPPTQGSFSGKGTSSLGGGGNGIDGVAIEAYANTNIESLPEYRRHILPILRKLSVGKPDVLVAYLLWAVKQKAWYFIPRKLENLPKEKVQLLFRSDQLALHGETEVFIEQELYQKSSMKDRAVLLLHEMVMAARLLMKKSPQMQCEALSKSTELNACRDSEMLKIASPMVVGKDDDIHSLNGLDHSTVRSLTVYLGDEKQDHSGTSVFAQRVRLGFVFPWDALLSKQTGEDLNLALQRSVFANDQFRTNDSQCLLQRSRNSPTQDNTWYFSLMASSQTEASLAPSEPESQNSTGPRVHNKNYMYSYISIDIPRSNSSALTVVETRGATDKTFGNGAIVDVFDVLPNIADSGDGIHTYPKVEFFVSRTQQARLLGYRLNYVRGLLRKKGTSLLRNWSEIEWVINKSIPTIECKLAN
jgi:hypothetical protein